MVWRSWIGGDEAHVRCGDDDVNFWCWCLNWTDSDRMCRRVKKVNKMCGRYRRYIAYIHHRALVSIKKRDERNSHATDIRLLCCSRRKWVMVIQWNRDYFYLYTIYTYMHHTHVPKHIWLMEFGVCGLFGPSYSIAKILYMICLNYARWLLAIWKYIEAARWGYTK